MHMCTHVDTQVFVQTIPKARPPTLSTTRGQLRGRFQKLAPGSPAGGPKSEAGAVRTMSYRNGRSTLGLGRHFGPTTPTFAQTPKVEGPEPVDGTGARPSKSVFSRESAPVAPTRRALGACSGTTLRTTGSGLPWATPDRSPMQLHAPPLLHVNTALSNTVSHRIACFCGRTPSGVLHDASPTASATWRQTQFRAAGAPGARCRWKANNSLRTSAMFCR